MKLFYRKMTGFIHPVWNKYLNSIQTLVLWRHQRVWDHLENIFWSSKTSKYQAGERQRATSLHTFRLLHPASCDCNESHPVTGKDHICWRSSSFSCRSSETRSWELKPSLCSWAFMSAVILTTETICGGRSQANRYWLRGKSFEKCSLFFNAHSLAEKQKANKNGTMSQSSKQIRKK